MQFFNRVFGAVNRAYLVRAYVIGVAIFAFLVWAMSSYLDSNPDKQFNHYGIFTYFAICTVLFPFAKLAWDQLRDFAMGGNLIVMNAIFLLMLKVWINAFLWSSAVFVAPLGMFWLWYKTRDSVSQGDDEIV